MSETSWLTSTKPYTLLSYIPRATPERKFRLFACASCRRIAALMLDERSLQCVGVVERFADDEATKAEFLAAAQEAELAERSASGNPARRAAYAVVLAAVPFSDVYVSNVIGRVLAAAHHRQEQNAQADLLRDIFGNPFRPIVFNPDWRTDTAVALAKGMYESRDFGAMPILADALQDAGCDNDDILNHCRDAKQVHVRGCWVVDLVLGKE